VRGFIRKKILNSGIDIHLGNSYCATARCWNSFLTSRIVILATGRKEVCIVRRYSQPLEKNGRDKQVRGRILVGQRVIVPSSTIAPGNVELHVGEDRSVKDGIDRIVQCLKKRSIATIRCLFPKVSTYRPMSIPYSHLEKPAKSPGSSSIIFLPVALPLIDSEGVETRVYDSISSCRSKSNRCTVSRHASGRSIR